MEKIIESLRSFGFVKAGVMAGVFASLVAFFIFFVFRPGYSRMGVLYDELDIGESAKIVSKLEAMSIPFEIKGDGQQILIPENQVAKARMSLAEFGLPSGGSVGYEIFDKGESFGATSFVQDLNHLRALEGELSRSISTLKPVQATRVHLVIPKKALFSNDKQEPRASVVIKVRKNFRINQPQIIAIQNLVASAVSGLTTDHVTIVDDKGALLTQDAKNSEEKLSAKNYEELKLSYEAQISRNLESLLEKTVGNGHVRVEVSADIDFDKISENVENYNPEGQVLRSRQAVSETSNTPDADENQGVTVQNSLPRGVTEQQSANQNNKNQSKRNEETTNYEISKTIRSLTKETGTIKRLSVAVLLDGSQTDGDKKTFKPIPEKDMDQIKSLVKSAIGFRQDRGDNVEIVNMPFAAPEQIMTDDSSKFALTKEDIVHWVNMAIVLLALLFIFIFIVKPMFGKTLVTSVGVNAEGAQNLNDEHTEEGAEEEPSELDKLIDKGRASGGQSSLKKIYEIIDQHPKETVAILRAWMRQK